MVEEANIHKQVSILSREIGYGTLGDVLVACVEDRELTGIQAMKAALWIAANDDEVWRVFMGPLFDAICYAAGLNAYGMGGWAFPENEQHHQEETK